MQTTLLGKCIVVTGATSGIGLAAAEILAQQGAWVIGVGRSLERCRAAEQHLRALPPLPGLQNSRVDYVIGDLAVQAQVRNVADQITGLLDQHGSGALDGLLNNAGTFTYWFTQTPEGFEMQWAVNHLAPFLLTNTLLPWLQRASDARVVTVSSDSHYAGRLHWDDPQLRRHYNGLQAYEQSKLANVLFTLELNRRLGSDSPVRAFAADPGLVKTDIGLKGTPGLVQRIWRLRRSGGISAEQSAAGIVQLFLGEPRQTSEIYWKHGLPTRPSLKALDVEAARRLWMISESMCSL
jgi:NAD(P)-dependent dehydrogenase (short-subunit alcohol dehydrogenase family)